MRVQVAIDEQVRQLVRSHRPELERLVDQALERELAQLVEQRLAARNGAPEQVRQVVPPAAVKTCRVCAKSKPVTEYEAGRAICRRAQERERVARREARVDNRAAPADLGDWLITEHLAELTPDGLVATTRGLELAAAIGWG